MKKKYYRKRDGTFYLDKTKKQILSEIDYNNPNTFLPYLKTMDYPYLEYEWNLKLKFCTENNFGNIFGRYISLMNLWGYKNFSFDDSKILNDIRKEKRLEVEKFDINN